MEILILALVLGGVVKYGVTDLVHAAKGKPNPRYEAAKARYAARTARVEARAKSGRGSNGRSGRGPGPLRCYLSTLWADAWTDAQDRHVAKRMNRDQSSSTRPDKPRGAARVFLDGLTGDARRAARRRWDRAWTSADERRRARATRVDPDAIVVPGEVVEPHNTADQSSASPESSAEPSVSSAGEDGRTDLRFGDDPTGPNGVRDCPICEGSAVWDGRPCPSCSARQQVRSAQWDSQADPFGVRPTRDYDGPNPVRRNHPNREDAMPNPTDRNNASILSTRKVIDMSSLNTTDLSNLDQVDAEISQARDAFTVLIEAQNEALQWAQNLPDRWAGTDFDTAGLRSAIAGVAESVQHGVDGDSLAALSRVTDEIKQARTVGEVADAADATGDVGSFRAS